MLDPGERPRKPPHPARGDLPEGGHALLRQPVHRPRRAVGQRQRAAGGAQAFEAFVQRPANQRKVLQFNFRPGNPDVAVGDPITAANGVDPNQPQTLFEVPDAAGDRQAARQVGRAAQERPGAARARRVGLDGGTGRPDNPTDRPSSTWPSRRPSRRSTSSSRTTRSACASSPPASGRTRTRTTSTSCRSHRSGRTARALAARIRDQSPLNGRRCTR